MANKYTNERYREITAYLKDHEKASVEELSELLFVSPATIRRDLSDMQKLGMIQRTHGGAMLLDNINELNIFVRIEKNAKEKQHTATVALNHLPQFNTVFIDNSSTCLVLAQRIDFQYKTIFTNGLELAVMLSNKKHVKVIFLGGVIQYSSYSTDGPLAVSMLDNFKIDLMLSSCAGLHLDGTYESTQETMQIKKKAFERSTCHMLLADCSKFYINQPYRTEKLEDYDAIFTDAEDDVIAPFVDKRIKIYNR